MTLNASQSQLRHNLMLRVSTEVIESRILSSLYILLTLADNVLHITHHIDIHINPYCHIAIYV